MTRSTDDLTPNDVEVGQVWTRVVGTRAEGRGDPYEVVGKHGDRIRLRGPSGSVVFISTWKLLTYWMLKKEVNE